MQDGRVGFGTTSFIFHETQTCERYLQNIVKGQTYGIEVLLVWEFAIVFPLYSRVQRTHQAAVVVGDLADLLDALLEHTVRGWVGYHKSGQVILVLDGLQEKTNSDDETLTNTLTHSIHNSGNSTVGSPF